jgi:prevent-host-death family protein
MGADTMKVEIEDAKARLCELVNQVRAGNEFVIAKRGLALARLLAVEKLSGRSIRFGLMKGEFVEPDDCDDPVSTARFPTSI